MADDQPALPAVQRAVAWTATCVSFLLVIFRLVIRIKSFKKLFSDDFLVIAAWLFLLTSSILWQIKSDMLFWMYDIQTGKRPPSPDFLQEYASYMPVVVAWNTLFYSCLWAVKFSFLMFFRRLGTRATGDRIWWWTVFVAAAIGWVACIADIDFGCTTKDLTYIMTQCGLASHVLFDDRTFYANMVVDIFTDLLILSIPFRLLWNVRIPLKKKLILLGVFSFTIFIILTAIIRVGLVKGTSGAVQVSSMDWLYLWSNVESGVAIVVACLASFRQLFVHNKQGGSGNSGQSPFRKILSYLGFDRLRSTTRLDGTPRSRNGGPEHRGSHGSLDHEVPLNAVRIRHSFDIIRDQPTGGKSNQTSLEPRGHEFV
ncbi:hypothetical protein INS49_015634 [Diaporthe citri]|uniref:uncharacterized protein n=1 Tax=Diaporthe citri TaxID=83186 RepID=UPI001C7F8050|nr:uncharacterized protein INS49_015634 [Diaporthe citri]KAG6356247.1 hypothetical protein INS49_015634 [Diaporthe citri]